MDSLISSAVYRSLLTMSSLSLYQTWTVLGEASTLHLMLSWPPMGTPWSWCWTLILGATETTLSWQLVHAYFCCGKNAKRMAKESSKNHERISKECCEREGHYQWETEGHTKMFEGAFQSSTVFHESLSLLVDWMSLICQLGSQSTTSRQLTILL